jgi:leucyl-tRNA synthetase
VKDGRVQAYAAAALKQIGPDAKPAVPALIEVVKKHKDPAHIARLQAIAALGKIGPPAKDAEWNDRGVEGAYRYLTRYWKMIEDLAQAKTVADRSWAPSGPRRDLRRRVHELSTRVMEDMDRLHLNTAVSGLMQIVNAVQDYQAAGGDLGAPEAAEAADMATRLLAPLAPHTAEELWQMLGHAEGLTKAPWPSFDPEVAKADEVVVPVQINGKVRARITARAGATEAELRELALADPTVKSYTAGKTILKVLVAKGPIVSVVVQ